MTKKLVFIGNSIVNGFPFSRTGSFAGLIGQETDLTVINKGNNGETTDDILRRFRRDVIDCKPDMVFIMTGTNDFIYNEASPKQAFENLSQMAALASANKIAPVLLTPIPVNHTMASIMWMGGVDYNDVNRQLEEFTQLILESEYENINLNTEYRECGKYDDGLHPLPEGHRFIADIILKYLKEKGAL